MSRDGAPSPDNEPEPTALATTGGPLVVRSNIVERTQVPAGLKYGEYKHYLREDFVFSCAYCTVMESEATTVRFTIDHYEPQSARSNLVDEYGNLMYACDECNRLKGARCPPAAAREAGHRFFRPDHDERDDHFALNGLLLKGTTPVGDFSVEMIDLNRQSLRRLRDIRTRLTGCIPMIAGGINALRHLPLDELPPHLRGPAATAIRRAMSVADKLVEDVDSVLRSFARSPFADEDPEGEARRQQRVASRKAHQALWPGLWTGQGVPKDTTKKPRKKRGRSKRVPRPDRD